MGSVRDLGDTREHGVEDIGEHWGVCEYRVCTWRTRILGAVYGTGVYWEHWETLKSGTPCPPQPWVALLPGLRGDL